MACSIACGFAFAIADRRGALRVTHAMNHEPDSDRKDPLRPAMESRAHRAFIPAEVTHGPVVRRAAHVIRRRVHTRSDSSAGQRIACDACNPPRRRDLFRAVGAFTSTPYVYLTDDSGIGNPHMQADTDRVGVERFRDLLTRVILSDLRGEGMHERADLPSAIDPVPG